jgi:hypothetical protein
MLVQPQHQWPYPEDLKTSVDEALERSLVPVPAKNYEGYVPKKKDVRSVQRLVLPPGKDAEWVSNEYFNWLPRFFSTLIKVDLKGNLAIFYLVHPHIQILILEKNRERSGPDRQLLYVVGGLLSGKQDRGRLEFREVLEKQYVISALHEFRPALPWWIYVWTQAVVHVIVMRAFGEYLNWYYISQQKVKA